MNSKFPLPALILILTPFFSARILSAQTMTRYMVDPWQGKDMLQTLDHPIIEEHGHANNSPSGSEVFSWDSFGRVRFDRKNPDSPLIGYRILTIDGGTDSRYLKSTMDDLDLAVGLHLGELAGWRVTTMLGAGYSSTRPFVHTSGIFGIGHLTFDRPIGPSDSFSLSVDYEGNGGLLPDVPLPGFAWVHHGEVLDTVLGFPVDRIRWRPTDALEITAQYIVPFTADIDAEYRLAKHVGAYGEAGNFFQGFVLPTGDITNRQFFQMRHVETGIRLIFDPLIDASIGIGYAFDQGYSSGFDVRNLRPIGHVSNEPYIAVVLRGRF